MPQRYEPPGDATTGNACVLPLIVACAPAGTVETLRDALKGVADATPCTRPRLPVNHRRQELGRQRIAASLDGFPSEAVDKL
jgi:hypothetical protein